MSDLVKVLAFAFRRKGAATMPGADLRLMLAYDLRWLAPEDAKRVVQRALQVGLLREEGEHLHAAFDVGAIDIPLNFKPRADVADDEGPFDAPPPRAPTAAPPLVAPAITAPTPPPTEATAPARAPAELDKFADAERARRGGMLSHEVARLVVERRLGADVEARLADAEARVLKG